MYLLSLGVSRIPAALPPLALALLTGLNAAAVGLIFFAALTLSRVTAKEKETILILFLSASFGTTYSAIWLFPVLTVAGGIVTVIYDWQGWRRMKERRQRRLEPVLEVSLHELDRNAESEAADLDQVKPDTVIPPSTTPMSTDSVVRRRAPPEPLPTSAPAPQIEATQFPSHFRLSSYATAGVIATFLSILIGVLVARATISFPPSTLQIFTNLYVDGTILFGGGPVVIPLLSSSFPPPLVSAHHSLYIKSCHSQICLPRSQRRTF